MNNYTLKRAPFQLIIVLATVLMACNYTPTPSPDSTQVVEAPTTTPSTVPVVRILPSRESEKQNVFLELVPQPNCAGSADVSASIIRERTIEYTLQLEAGVSVGTEGTIGVPGVGEVQVGSQVAAQYGVTYGREDKISRSVTVSAKAGTNILHTLELFDLWETGQVEIAAAGKTMRYPYRFRRDFGLQLKNSEQQPCPTATATRTPTIVPFTPTIEPTSTPTILPATPTTTEAVATETAAEVVATETLTSTAEPVSTTPVIAECSPNISFGETVQCAIEPATKIDTYGFTADGDDTILVRMARTTDTLQPLIRVLNEDGTEACFADRNTIVQIINCRLISGGNYKIQAASTDAATFGKYTLYLQRLNNPGRATPIDFGQTIKGKINTKQQIDTYTFTSNGDDRILIRATRTSDTLQPRIFVLDSNGKQVCFADRNTIVEIRECLLVSTGKYTILMDATDTASFGSYDIYLQRLNNPGGAVQIKFGQTVKGEIRSRQQIDTYTFNANGDDHVSLRANRTSDTLQPRIFVLNLNGERVCFADRNSIVEIRNCLLVSAGTYTILMDATDANSIGSYELLLTKP